MAGLPVEQVLGVVLELFSEAYEGASKPYTWFVDNRPDAGLFGTLAGISAAKASQAPVPGGSAIAAHTEHLRWSLALANEYRRGGTPTGSWKESWSVREVDEAAWVRLQADLRQEYEALRAGMPADVDWSQPEVLTGVMALAPHVAYHLGAIRQMIGFLSHR